ncbi:MAG: cystathionine beta-lyase [SAR324 cluster bacterium]|nr:cystathionine beta-lyase [SAR324 cluster bacterium]
MHDDTRVVRLGRHPEAFHGAVNPPVYHVSTILSETVEELEERGRATEVARHTSYGRKGNPTSWALEDAIAELEGGFACLTFPSGIAAVGNALLAFLNAGDHLLMVDSVYGPTRDFCNKYLTRFGVETTFYDPCIGSKIRELIRTNTKLLFLESPGSQTFEVQDVPTLSTIAHAHDLVVMMDNTWGTPLFFKAFQHGVDVSIQAGTKYIVGHADVSLGTVTTTREFWPVLQDAAWQLGQCSGPDDLYLAQRGLRTMSVRLSRHQQSAIEIAGWLQKQPEIKRVLYPALTSDPGYSIWQRDFFGASGLFGVELHPCDPRGIKQMLNGMELFGMGYSWGGYESLILPTNPRSMRTASPWRYEGPLLRLHIGLEALDDLRSDLEAGLKRLREAS